MRNGLIVAAAKKPVALSTKLDLIKKLIINDQDLNNLNFCPKWVIKIKVDEMM